MTIEKHYVVMVPEDNDISLELVSEWDYEALVTNKLVVEGPYIFEIAQTRMFELALGRD